MRYVEICPVGCSSKLRPTVIGLPEGPLLECVACGQLVSQASASRYWETMRDFDALDFNQPAGRELERRTRVAERRLRRIAKLAGMPPKSMRILDVGCSRGHFVATAAAMGFDAEGVEPAPGIAAAARADGLKVHAGLLEDVRFPDHSFAALTLFEVIEHLKDPLVLLRECHRILRPGGIVCLTTGNAVSWTASVMGARWDYFDMDKDGGHVSFYNPRSVALLAGRAGFTSAGLETTRVSFSDKRDAMHRIFKVAAELLNMPARLAGRGHSMLAYFRRA
jgi:SAM-dependent methyltransferase